MKRIMAVVGVWGSAGSRTWLVPDFEATFSINSALLSPSEQGAYRVPDCGLHLRRGGSHARLGRRRPAGKRIADGFNGGNDLALYFDNPIPSLRDPAAID